MNGLDGIVQSSSPAPEPHGQPRDVIDALLQMGTRNRQRVIVSRGGHALTLEFYVAASEQPQTGVGQ